MNTLDEVTRLDESFKTDENSSVHEFVSKNIIKE